jgi:CubicO group peptidase (beta-lactamase class C family)
MRGSGWSRRGALGLLVAAPAVLRSGRPAAAAAARRWIVSGGREPQLDGLDAAMQALMWRHGIRSAALAVARGGKTLFEHTYTWADTSAEPDYPVVQPDSPFRLASVSKAFTAALIYELAEARALDLDAPVFPLVGLERAIIADQRVDPRLLTITARHLIDHRGGWDADPVFRMRDVARRLGLHVAPTARDIARFMVGEPVRFAPGTQSRYSNFGYLMLGLAAAKMTGMDFPAALKARVAAPLGIAEVHLARTRKERRLPREGFYDQPGSGLTPEFPDREVRAPLPYGGGGWLTESMDAPAGLAASAGAVARLIGHYAVWGFGRRRDGQTAARSGVMSGTTSFALSRADGLDLCLIINTRSAALDAATLEITRVLDAAEL